MADAHDPYIRAAIDGEIKNLAAAVEGDRNRTLFLCSVRLASFAIDHDEILHRLRPVAIAIGMRVSEITATIKSGVRRGRSRPRHRPTNQVTQTAQIQVRATSDVLPSSFCCRGGRTRSSERRGAAPHLSA